MDFSWCRGYVDQDPLGIDSQLLRDQVRKDILYMRSKTIAKKILDTEHSASQVVPTGVLADDPLPEAPPELINGILLRYGATGIIGAKETGKSLIALEIQHSLLTGEPLWGVIKPSEKLEKTCHFLAEHASPVLMGLYQRTELSKTGRLKIFGPEHLASMKLLVSNGARREEAISFYKKCAEGSGLVVFDPLASFIQGESAENDNAPMRSLVDSMIEIAQSTGAACLILGHQGKPMYFQGRQVKKTSYATRGASAAEDAMTAVHYLERESGVSVNGCQVFELRPTHFKGFKSKPFKLLRDARTCRHTLSKM